MKNWKWEIFITHLNIFKCLDFKPKYRKNVSANFFEINAVFDQVVASNTNMKRIPQLEVVFGTFWRNNLVSRILSRLLWATRSSYLWPTSTKLLFNRKLVLDQKYSLKSSRS